MPLAQDSRIPFRLIKFVYVLFAPAAKGAAVKPSCE